MNLQMFFWNWRDGRPTVIWVSPSFQDPLMGFVKYPIYDLYPLARTDRQDLPGCKRILRGGLQSALCIEKSDDIRERNSGVFLRAQQVGPRETIGS